MAKWMCLAGLAALMLPVTASAQCYDYRRPLGDGYWHYYHSYSDYYYPRYRQDYYSGYRSRTLERWRWQEWD